MPLVSKLLGLVLIFGMGVTAGAYPLFDTLTPAQFDQDRFLDSCDRLFEANSEAPFFKGSCRELVRDILDVEQIPKDIFEVFATENSPYLSIVLGGYDESLFDVFYNGSVLFMGRSYMNRTEAPDSDDFMDDKDPSWQGEMVRDKGVLVRGREVVVLDQNRVFIDTLPEKVKLSRCMGSWEYKHWKKGTLSMSEFRGDRIHFGYVKFKFDDSICVQYQIPKKILLELDRLNLLEVNTYELEEYLSENFYDVGMDPISYSPFGIPFEVVVFAQEGVDLIKPYMRKGKKF